MLFLNRREVEQALPMDEVIRAMKLAFSALSAGQVQLPLRTQIPVDEQDAVALFMPAYLHHPGRQALCLKAVSVFPGNQALDLPTIHAAVLVLDPKTGQVQALLEGSSLTALRTGAASGAATDLLARPGARVGAVFGAGIQGRTQLQAICEVRDLEQVWIYDLNPERARTLIEEQAGKGMVPKDLRLADSAAQAVASADVICTATTALDPVFSWEDLKRGVHINGVGSYTPEMVEIPPEGFRGSGAFVGSLEGVMEESGEVIMALDQGFLSQGEITELGKVINGNAPGRISADQITIFKSVGAAVQDAAAAHLALENARKGNLGQELVW